MCSISARFFQLNTLMTACALEVTRVHVDFWKNVMTKQLYCVVMYVIIDYEQHVNFVEEYYDWCTGFDWCFDWVRQNVNPSQYLFAVSAAAATTHQVHDFHLWCPLHWKLSLVLCNMAIASVSHTYVRNRHTGMWEMLLMLLRWCSQSVDPVVDDACLQHCDAVCASLQAVDYNKDIAEFINKAATGTDRPGCLACWYGQNQQ